MNFSEEILSVKSIVKKFSNVYAVNELSFGIKKGEIFALVGPNGAGKTTTVRMLMNIIRPDKGEIIFNFPKENSLSQIFGYLPEERGLYQEIPVLKTLIFMGIIRGMDKKSAGKSAEAWLEKLGLYDRRKDKLNMLSKGNQQKIQFISSIIHNPSFAILDEPFSGLDPINQETFLRIIKDLAAGGTTILLSSHQMQLVERIANRVLLMNNGKLVTTGAVKEIKKQHSSQEILFISIEGKTDFSVLRNNEAVEKYEVLNDSEIKIYLKKNMSLSGLLELASTNYNINTVRSEHISLHDIFIERVQNDRRNGDE